MKLLIIEDEAGLSESIRNYFTDAGDSCAVAYDYPEGIQKVNSSRYDCILLDLTLPHGNGLDILIHIRSNRFNDGVLVMSAKNAADGNRQALEFGADGYLGKPFHLSALRTRVMTIGRAKRYISYFVDFKEIRLDVRNGSVFVNAGSVDLSVKQFTLLLYFIDNKGKSIPMNALAWHLGEDVWLTDQEELVSFFVKSLREKLMASGCRDYISSLSSGVYKLTDG
ncbi:response regulator transcription factor [Mucilaginibacter sp.]|uniref:response regulator transcription factor n=1 Tax=Mucilaginibacter sp. TaxID=1882438 RepID=UPI000CABA77F|nr:response regulator transcription factor [Mucilaginibacter sp.]PLW90972.1 MAG: DNA-binding response regulator [Mucilaginibacter sp.]PMP66321.1 MAG: DNA-binding response regulator [Mucilaginibacter sp.]HEK21337.1 response regulator transcription factor [Bacteroidota bacterium]